MKRADNDESLIKTCDETIEYLKSFATMHYVFPGFNFYYLIVFDFNNDGPFYNDEEENLFLNINNEENVFKNIKFEETNGYKIDIGNKIVIVSVFVLSSLDLYKEDLLEYRKNKIELILKSKETGEIRLDFADFKRVFYTVCNFGGKKSRRKKFSKPDDMNAENLVAIVSCSCPRGDDKILFDRTAFKILEENGDCFIEIEEKIFEKTASFILVDKNSRVWEFVFEPLSMLY